MKKIFTMLFISLLIISGCAKSQTPAAKLQKTTKIKHDLGETEVPINPEKIAVFDLGILETLDNLNIKVAGVPQKDLDPSLKHYQDSQYSNIGSLFEPNYEVLFALKPDLIIISGRTAEHYEELSKLAPTIYLAPDNKNFLNSIYDLWEQLAMIFTEKEELINNEVEQIKETVHALNKLTIESDLRALVLMVSGNDLSVFGSQSRFGMIFDDFKVKQTNTEINDSNHGENISFEYLVNVDPDILYVLDRGQIVGSEISAQDFLDNDLVNQTRAAQNNKIIYLDTASWYLKTTSLQSIKTMIDEISSSLQ